MGLDNGLVLRVKKPIKKLDRIFPLYKDFEENSTDTYYDVAYWRKMNNVRDIFIIDYKCKSGKNSEISLDDLILIISNLKELISSQEDWGSPYLDLSDARPLIHKQCRALTRLCKFLKRNPELEYNIIFYDSF